MLNLKKYLNNFIFKFLFYSFLFNFIIILFFVILNYFIIKKDRNIEFNYEINLFVQDIKELFTFLIDKNDFKVIQNIIKKYYLNNSILIRLYNYDLQVIASPWENEIGKYHKINGILDDIKLKSNYQNIIINEFQNKAKIGILVTDNNNKIYLLLIDYLYNNKRHFVNYNKFLNSEIIILILIFNIFIFFLLILIKKYLDRIKIIAYNLSKNNLYIRFEDTNITEFDNIINLLKEIRDILLRKIEELENFKKDMEKKVIERTIELENTYKELDNAYKTLKLTKDKLIQADKMAAIGQISAGIAHEINNPITFIKTNLTILNKYVINYKIFFKELESRYIMQDLKNKYKIDKINSDIENIISESIEGCERIESIVKSMRNYSYQEKGEPEFLNINNLIDQSLNILKNKLKENIKIIKEYSNLPDVQCYKNQIIQIFVNIIDNSIQAIKDFGEIKIKTYSLDKNIIIEVIDNGIGIEEIYLDKLFTPFFTTKEIGKGTGLGLYLVYQLIKIHNGSIEIKSNVGQGTTVIISLPFRLE